MESNILPKIYTSVEYNIRKEYIKEMSPEEKGFRIKEDELLIATEGESEVVFSYTRIPELRLVEKIQLLHPEDFKKIMELSLRGEVSAVENFISGAFGEDFSEKIKKKDANIKELIAMIELKGVKAKDFLKEAEKSLASISCMATYFSEKNQEKITNLFNQVNTEYNRVKELIKSIEVVGEKEEEAPGYEELRKTLISLKLNIEKVKEIKA